MPFSCTFRNSSPNCSDGGTSDAQVAICAPAEWALMAAPYRKTTRANKPPDPGWVPPRNKRAGSDRRIAHATLSGLALAPKEAISTTRNNQIPATLRQAPAIVPNQQRLGDGRQNFLCCAPTCQQRPLHLSVPDRGGFSSGPVKTSDRSAQ